MRPSVKMLQDQSPATESSFFLALWPYLRIKNDQKSKIWRVGLVVVWLQCLHVARGSQCISIPKGQRPAVRLERDSAVGLRGVIPTSLG